MQKDLAWFQTAGEIVRRRDHRRDMTYIGANDSEARRLQKKFGAASAGVSVMSMDTVKHRKLEIVSTWGNPQQQLGEIRPPRRPRGEAFS